MGNDFPLLMIRTLLPVLAVAGVTATESIQKHPGIQFKKKTPGLMNAPKLSTPQKFKKTKLSGA